MLTDLDIATGIKKNVVTLDITVDNILCVQVFQATASLSNVNSHEGQESWFVCLTSRQIVEI
jgi:hypothetical protein